MDERKPGDMGRWGDAGDYYWCRDCQSKEWSPVQHDGVHAHYEATGRDGETLRQWNQRKLAEHARMRKIGHLDHGELAQAAWLHLTEYLGERYGVHPPEPRGRNIETLIGMGLPPELYDLCRDSTSTVVPKGCHDDERMLDQLRTASKLINDEIFRVATMLEEQKLA